MTVDSDTVQIALDAIVAEIKRQGDGWGYSKIEDVEAAVLDGHFDLRALAVAVVTEIQKER